MSEDEADDVLAPNKLWLETINANMKKMMTEMFQELRREQQPPPEHKRARARKDQELKAKPPDHTLKSTRRSSQNISHTSKPNTAFYSGIELFKFSGKRNYIDWEENMDEWFYYNHIPSKERLPYAVQQLTGKAREWWLEDVDDRWYYKRPSITSWRDLKKLLRNKYVPQSPNHTAQANTTIQRSTVPEKKPALASEQMKTSTPLKAMKIQMEQMFKTHMEAYQKEVEQNSNQKHSSNRQRSKQEKTARQDKEQPRQSKSVSGKGNLDHDLAIQKKLVEQKGELILVTNQRQISNSKDIDARDAEPIKLSDQRNQSVFNSSHNMITFLSCPKEAEKCTGNVEESSATQHSVMCPDKEMEQSPPEPRVSTDSTTKEMDLTAKSTPHL